MPYNFIYDLSDLSKPLFNEISRICDGKDVYDRIDEISRQLVKKYKVQEITRLPLSDVLLVIQDIIINHIANISQRKEFQNTDNRALFLPHCSRKHMDKHCQAYFDTEVSSYFCNECSSNCPINQAAEVGKSKDYDVYIMPGGSGIRKLAKKYEGIIGVACCIEINLAKNLLKDDKIVILGLPLTKNGCSNTSFSLESLQMIL